MEKREVGSFGDRRRGLDRVRRGHGVSEAQIDRRFALASCNLTPAYLWANLFSIDKLGLRCDSKLRRGFANPLAFTTLNVNLARARVDG